MNVSRMSCEDKWIRQVHMAPCEVLVAVVRKTTRLRLRLNVCNEETVLTKMNRSVGIVTFLLIYVASNCHVRLTPGYERPITLRRVIARGSGRGAVLHGRIYRVVAQYSDLPWETKWRNSQPDEWRQMYSLLLVSRGQCRLNPWFPGT